MPQSRTIHAVLCLSTAVLAAGVLLSVNSFRTTPGRIGKMRKNQDVLARLHDVQKIASAERAAVRKFEKDASGRPCPLKDLAGSHRADIRQRENLALPGGWTLHRTEVVFNDIPFAAAGAFMRAAEECRPPWRVAECQFSASPRTEPAGSVTLVLEALEKTGGGK